MGNDADEKRTLTRKPTQAFCCVGVSNRCSCASCTDLTVYFPAFNKAKEDLFDKDTNPNGYIPMCVAENRVMRDELEAKFREVFRDLSEMDKFPRTDLFDYGSWTGTHEMKEAVVKAVTGYLAPPTAIADIVGCHKGVDIPLIAEDVLCVTNGCGPAINLLAFGLADRSGKECFLSTTPGYPVFATDCGLQAGVPVVSTVKTSIDTGFAISISALEKAYGDCVADGYHPRALITVNPGNPTGSVATGEELRAVRTWCADKDMWWISDEIYACGTHNDSPRPHVSALNLPLLEGDRDPATIVLWGFSKDLGLSGMRLGFGLTLPRQRGSDCVATLEHASDKLYGMFCAVSPVAQLFCARLLGDTEWLGTFFDRYRERLTACKIILCEGLTKLGIPYFKPYGAIFLWADLSEFTGTSSRADFDLFDTLQSDPYRLVVTPGSCFFSDKPGMVRLCYAWMSEGEEACKEVIRRLSTFVADHRR
ncbi:hypothetical protein FOL47_006255 [Perkinsus chesapeaki]|uniref:Aminotransferase class I/classII large domain-containing protein n=1 Tax=Perkinsus chesapeaki TaxID=330153 RepID=A0A7J6LSW5_PERCH|nr:hypothetical protein FOL47_006255 [Perkinsus chesapeaki]